MLKGVKWKPFKVKHPTTKIEYEILVDTRLYPMVSAQARELEPKMRELYKNFVERVDLAIDFVDSETTTKSVLKFKKFKLQVSVDASKPK